MAHTHNHSPANFSKAFAIGIALNLGFVIVEAGYGLNSHSMALLSDAGHNLSDVFGLLLAWGAFYLVKRKPTARHTYGLRRTTILAALLNAAILLLVTGGVAWEAVLRFAHPSVVAGSTVAWVALIGVIINTATALMFMKGQKDDLNIRGAFTHMASDALVALGVVVTGILLVKTGWLWLDPAVSLVISLVIVLGTWSLLRESVRLALDAVPENIDAKEVGSYLEDLPGISEVHDLHIWAMSTTEAALTAHLVKKDNTLDDELLARITSDLHDKFGIEHPTIQFEHADSLLVCSQASKEVV
jgi:cobalt-zinc-cadmium efflux system protein